MGASQPKSIHLISQVSQPASRPLRRTHSFTGPVVSRPSQYAFLPSFPFFHLDAKLLIFLFLLGGVVLEHDEENDRLVAKPYNVNEVNRQKQLDEEQEPKQSLVTASILAQQAKSRTS
jgi:hypothetical protein